MMAGLLFLLPMVLLQDPAIDVSSDLALQKKVTVALRAQPINDALKEIGKAAGVTCAAVQNIWDLKVSVFCKDEPAGPVMNQIAEVLGAEWTKEGDTYRLGFERVAQQQRTAYELAETRLMRERIEKGLLSYSQLAAVNPNAPKPKPELKARLDMLAKDPSAISFGRMLGSMNSSAASGFWRGEVRTYLPPMAPPPPESSQAFPSEETRVTARFDPHLLSINRHPGRDAELENNMLVLYDRPPAALATSPFAKDVLAWPGGSTIPADDERFKRAVQAPPIVRSDFFVRKPVMDDHLEAFHRSTGIAIVGDSFSVTQFGRPAAGDARSWIASAGGLKADAKVLNGVVGVRHRAFWRLRQFEIPDSAIDSYQLLANIAPLTLDQYAALAARLKPVHLSALSLADAVSLNFDTTPFVRMLPALQFYNLLTPAQKRQAHSGLDATKLSDVQKRAFLDAMLLGLLKNKTNLSYMSLAAKGDFTNMGVVVADESFESGLKDKKGKAILSGRKFHIHLGTRSEPIRFEAEVKGPQPKDQS